MTIDPETNQFSVSAVINWSESAASTTVTAAAQAFFDAFVAGLGLDADQLSLTAVLTE